MTKHIIYDTDGMVLQREMYFSERLSRDFGIPLETILPFFKNEFQLCLVGKADLKEELKKYVEAWQWSKSIDELLAFWFSSESTLNPDMLASVKQLRERGIRCYLDTNNEKYRVQYITETLGFNKLFDGVFASSAIGFKKPQPEFWQAIANGLGNPGKGQVIVWDNEEKNITSAKAFGFQAELYTDFAAYEERLKVIIR